MTACTKFVEEGSQLRHPKLNGLGEVALFPIEMHVLATALIWSGRLRSLLASLEHGGHTTAAPPTAFGGASLLRREGFARRGHAGTGGYNNNTTTAPALSVMPTLSPTAASAADADRTASHTTASGVPNLSLIHI